MVDVPQDGTFRGPVPASGDAPSVFSFVVEGVEYTGWTRVAVSWSAHQAARSFAFTMADTDGTADWTFVPDDSEVLVLVDGKIVCTGFIDHFAPSYSGTEHKIELAGRSKSADLIDGDADHPTGEFNGMTIAEIAEKLAPDGFKISSDVPMSRIPKFRLTPGETIFQALDRAAVKAGLFLTSTADGGIKITQGGTGSVHPKITEGGQILTASATFNNANRHSLVKVRGQRAIGALAKGSLQIEQAAPDRSMRRPRTKIVVAESDGGDTEAARTAHWMQQRKYGESIRASIRMPGARDPNGLMWQVNTRVYVQSQMLRMNQEMMILSVEISQDKGGTFTVMELVHPLAFAGPTVTEAQLEVAAAPPTPKKVEPPAYRSTKPFELDQMNYGLNDHVWTGSFAPIVNPKSDNKK